MENQNNLSEPGEIYQIETETEGGSPEDVLALMEKPFDPTLINIDTKTPSLDTLVKRISHGEILLNTETYFQREPNLWKPTQQSRLIESILIRFPLPAFYFDGSDKNKWLVVDGLQRLSSIRNFIIDKEKPLRLTNLEFLTQLEGKTYDELDRDLQRIIEETTVVVYIINPGTPVDVKFNIFKRINTGGLVLEPQEIRHALFQGAPAKFIAELGSLQEFEEATTGALKRNNRMIDRDFANRFLGFYLFGYQNYEPDLDTFMSRAMASIYDMDEDKKVEIKRDYIASLKLNKDIFGDNAFRKIDPVSQARKPINKAIFDAFSVQFALLSEDERNVIKKCKELIVDGFIRLLQDQNFFSSVSSSTGDKRRVTNRHLAIYKLIHETINSYNDKFH